MRIGRLPISSSFLRMAEHAPFAQPGDPAPRIGLDVFEDALLARLAGVPLGVGVEVVGVYLELYGPDGLERLRFDDGHVVCGADGGTCHVAARRPADIGSPGLDFTQDGGHKPLFLHLFCQREGVAAPDAQGFCLAYHARGVFGPVYRAHADTQLREACLHLFSYSA